MIQPDPKTDDVTGRGLQSTRIEFNRLCEGRSRPRGARRWLSSLVIILTWVYYSAQIVLFGAEVTHVYSHQHGSQMQVPHLVAVPSGATTAGGALNNNCR